MNNNNMQKMINDAVEEFVRNSKRSTRNLS